MTTRQTPDAVREAVARIVDPKAWEDHDYWASRLRGEGDWPTAPDEVDMMRRSYERRMPLRVAESFRRTDAILAALDSRAGDDLTPRERIARVVAWEHFGIAWHHMEKQSHADVLAMVDRMLDSRAGDAGEGWARPLCWTEPHPSHSYPNWTAGDANIMFSARINTSEPLSCGKFPLSINGTVVAEKFDTVDAAKAYAQRNYAKRILSALSATPAPAVDAREMTPEEHRLEDLKQMAAYGGPIVSFDVRDGYYLASCDHCGWVGSSELCGTDSFGDDSDVYCPRCHAAGADCGNVAERIGLSATRAPAGVEKCRADMAAALRNTPTKALREAGYLERAAQMIEAPAADAVPAGEVRIPHNVAVLIDQAFLPTNPARMRAAAPEVIEAAKAFKAALASLSHGEGRK